MENSNMKVCVETAVSETVIKQDMEENVPSLIKEEINENLTYNVEMVAIKKEPEEIPEVSVKQEPVDNDESYSMEHIIIKTEPFSYDCDDKEYSDNDDFEHQESCEDQQQLLIRKPTKSKRVKQDSDEDYIPEKKKKKKKDQDNVNRIASDTSGVTDATPKEKPKESQVRRCNPQVKQKQMDISTTSQCSKDDCYHFGKLLEKRMRKIPVRQRDLLMIKIKRLIYDESYKNCSSNDDECREQLN